MSSTFFSHGSTRFRYNADYSGEDTITISHVAIIAHLILGHPVTLGDSVDYVTHKTPGYIITSFPIIQ